MIAQTNHQITKYAAKNKWHSDLFTNGKNLTAKTPSGGFRLPLSKFHYYYNKWLQVKEFQYLIPIYSWTLTPIPNWTCSVVTISLFNARLPSTWLTNARIPVRDFNHQLAKVVGCKVRQFIPTIKIKKMLGHKTLRCTYTATSSQEWWTRAKLCLPLQIAWTNFAQHLCNLCTLWWPLK